MSWGDSSWFDSIAILMRESDGRRPAEIKADIRDEIEFHLAMAEEEGKRKGLSDVDARRAALDAFGDRTEIETTCRTIQLGNRTLWHHAALIMAAGFAAMLLVLLVLSYRNQSLQQTELEGLRASFDSLQENMLALAEQTPPVVVETFPSAGAIDVDPAAREIRVRFSKEMLDHSWSWCETEHPFPESAGPIHYRQDSKTCVMPVRLEPGTKYVLTINSPNYRNFKDTRGHSAPPYVLHFQTAAVGSAKRSAESM